jgi:heterodisulfide reductase subunit B
MKTSYYPGCTLKTKARNLEDAALASLAALSIEVEELERWNCCGAVYSLADDDLIHQVAPVRNLVRAKDAGAGRVVTLCAQCYNVLARGNLLMREDEDKRRTLNMFMEEETDYHGEVEVVHYLDLLREEAGWDRLRRQVRVPLEGLRVAPFYGCALLRPHEIGVGGQGNRPTIMQDLLTALGATPVEFPLMQECCGAYEIVANPAQSLERSARVVASALGCGVDAMVLSCPLCEYNLGKKQGAAARSVPALPVYYFTQLLAVALGLGPASCRFDLNMVGARALLERRGFLDASIAV